MLPTLIIGILAVIIIFQQIKIFSFKKRWRTDQKNMKNMGLEIGTLMMTIDNEIGYEAVLIRKHYQPRALNLRLVTEIIRLGHFDSRKTNVIQKSDGEYSWSKTVFLDDGVVVWLFKKGFLVKKRKGKTS